MTTFYHVQVGALETQEFRTTHRSVLVAAFQTRSKAPIHQVFFVVLLPNGMVVAP
jgi:hypothetical protein